MAWDSPSKGLLLACAAFVTGILVAPISSLGWQETGIAMVMLLGGLLVLKNRSTRFVLLVAVAFLAGVFRFGQVAAPPTLPLVSDAAGRSVRVEATVTGEVERRMGYDRAVLADVSLAGVSAHGKLLARLPQHSGVRHGDRVAFSCRIQAPEPIEGFRYDKYLASQGILATCGDARFADVVSGATRSFAGASLATKEFLTSRLASLFPEPHASFLSGLVFGGNSSLSSGLKEDFSRTGTSHILAASGFNVSLFTYVFLSWIIATPVGRARGMLLTLGLLAAYVVMAGAGAAVVRAALMAVLVLVAMGIRRKPYAPTLLLATLAAMLAWNPLLLSSDVGFQLSFLATAAIVWVAPHWQKMRAFAFVPGAFAIREAFVGSLAASLLTLPIILWHFGAVSVVSPFVNLLVLPTIPYLIGFALAALAASLVSMHSAALLALPAWAVSNVLLHVIGWFSAVEFAAVEPVHAGALSIASAGMLIFFFLWHSRRRATAVNA